MKIGTKSVLFGAHCFFIHPFVVALAWYKLWGFDEVDDPYIGKVSLKNRRLWLAFFVHDLGYLGKSNMDGVEGEMHPFWGARIMHHLCDPSSRSEEDAWRVFYEQNPQNHLAAGYWLGPWGQFVLLHSRFLARTYDRHYSMLCVADKLAIALEPWWLYLPRVTLSGEIKEYMARAQAARQGKGKYAGEPAALLDSSEHDITTGRGWHRAMTSYCKSFAYEHKDGKRDTWTQARAAA